MRIENSLLALYRGTEYFSLARTFLTVWGEAGREGNFVRENPPPTGQVYLDVTRP